MSSVAVVRRLLPSSPWVLLLSLSALMLTGCVTPPTRRSVHRRTTATRGRVAATPPRAPAATAPVLSVEEGTRLQVFLDDAGFGPGKIDGRGGEFTRKALAHYGRAHGLGPLTVTPNLPDRLPGLRGTRAFTEYTVTAADAATVGTLPARREDQARARALPYTGLLELVAERFHAEPAFLQRLNPGRNLAALVPGDQLRVPAVDRPLVVSQLPPGGKLLPVRPELVGRTVQVRTGEKMLDVLDEGGRLVAAFPVTPGSAKLPAPPGTWRIVNVASMPFFRYDEAMLQRGERSDQALLLPPGPNSPVGVVWMGLNRRGIGLHGTNSPDTIGRAASHGCIRLSNWDAVRLSGLVTTGTTVVIQ